MNPVLQLAKEKNLASIALVYLDDDFPRDVAAGVRKKAAELGLRLALDEQYGTNLSVMPALAQRVAAANADIVISASYLDDAVAFAKAAKAAAVKPKIFAFSGAPAVPEFVTRVGEANAHGMISTVQWTRGIRLPGSYDLSFRYESQYGGYPNYDVAGAYAAGQVLESAIRLAGTVDRAAVRNELATLKTRTTLGNYRVDATGLQTAKTTYLVQCQQDHISLVYPPEVARFPLVYPYPG
jgi:branched-chain amino acid transport system substrate-binding protein